MNGPVGKAPPDALDPTSVPEPSRWLLLAAGLACPGVLRRVARPA
jgi:hypothetical protein